VIIPSHPHPSNGFESGSITDLIADGFDLQNGFDQFIDDILNASENIRALFMNFLLVIIGLFIVGLKEFFD
jgi:hypothetical protein